MACAWTFQGPIPLYHCRRGMERIEEWEHEWSEHPREREPGQASPAAASAFDCLEGLERREEAGPYDGKYGTSSTSQILTQVI